MLSQRFDDALAFASELLRARPLAVAGPLPIAHTLTVAALTLEYGADEDCAIAALLHHVTEHTDRRSLLAEAGHRYGDTVRTLIEETTPHKCEASWRSRQQAFLETIPTLPDDSIRIIACCALHEASTILETLITDGFSAFDHLPERRAGTLWYYRELAEALQMRDPGPMSARLSKLVAQIEYWVSSID